MARYRITDTWTIAAPADRIWQALLVPEQWAGSVPGLDVSRSRAADPDGLGERHRVHVGSWWGQALAFEIESVHRQPPHAAEVRLWGDLEGTGRWRLRSVDGATAVEFRWSMSTTKRWMNALAPVGRPAFNLSHAVMSRRAAHRFAEHVGATLRRAESRAQPSGTVGWALMLAPAGVLAARRLAHGR